MPGTQKRNDQRTALLSADFQPRWDAAFAFRTASMNLGLLGLRGFWPMSSFDEAGNAYDLSGQARTLTYNGNPTYSRDGLLAYINFDGTGDYLARADEAGLDILGTEASVLAASRGLSMGGWFFFNAAAGTAEVMMSKWNTNQVNQRAYKLQRDVAGTISFSVSVDGTAVTTVTSTTSPAVRNWFFAAGQFDPSTNMNVWINDAVIPNAAAIPASIFNSNSDLRISGNGAGTSLLNGRASLCFLCGALLPDSEINVLYWHTRAMLGLK